MLRISFTNRMKRDAKRLQKRGKDMRKLEAVLALLASENPMPDKYHDHQLKGEFKDFRECHIEPDWLLMYQVFENELILSRDRLAFRFVRHVKHRLNSYGVFRVGIKLAFRFVRHVKHCSLLLSSPAHTRALSHEIRGNKYQHAMRQRASPRAKMP